MLEGLRRLWKKLVTVRPSGSRPGSQGQGEVRRESRLSVSLLYCPGLCSPDWRPLDTCDTWVCKMCPIQISMSLWVKYLHDFRALVWKEKKGMSNISIIFTMNYILKWLNIWLQLISYVCFYFFLMCLMKNFKWMYVAPIMFPWDSVGLEVFSLTT